MKVDVFGFSLQANAPEGPKRFSISMKDNSMKSSTELFIYGPRMAAFTVLIVSYLASGVAWGLPEPVSAWQFNGDFINDIAGGDPLTVNGGQAVTFTTSTIGGNSAQVGDVPALSNANNTISAVNPIGPNGGAGATQTNDYTLIMDVNFPTFPGTGSFASLLETDPSNNDDVDFFVRSSGNVDLELPQIPAGITADTWYRMAFRSDATEGSLTTQFFLDGQLIMKSSGGQNLFNGEATLGTSMLFFSDNNGDTVRTLVNSIALYDTPLSNADIAELGAATFGGIQPVPGSVVPTLSEWGIITLVPGLAGAAFLKVRKLQLVPVDHR